MNMDEIIKLEISLEDLSSIAIAISLWERQDVKEKIRNNFDGGKYLHYKPYGCSEKETIYISSCQKIVNYIIEQLDLMRIPKPLLLNIKILVVKIGQKIFYWRHYAKYVLELSEKYVEKIFWTCNGQIDELKILQEVWLNDKNFPIMEPHRCFIDTSNSLYCLAAMYGQENFIKNHLECMKSQIFPYLNVGHRKPEWTTYDVIATWVFFCSNKKKTIAIREFKTLRRQADQLPAVYILRKCIARGNIFGTKYFWAMLNENEKEKIVAVAAMESLDFYENVCEGRYTDIDNSTTYCKEMSIRLVLFFIDKMTEIQKIEFITQNFIPIITFLFKTWPYQEVCEKFLYQMWHQISFNHQLELLCKIFNNLINKSPYDLKPDYFTEKNFSDNILRNLIKKSSKELKITFLTNNNYEILPYLYENLDNGILKLIINDVDLKHLRKQMFIQGDEYLKKFFRKKDYESVNEFTKNMKLFGDELKSFKRNLNILYEFLICGDLIAAEEHLNWLGDTDEERSEFKNEMDAFEIIFFLIQNYKFDIADKFLLWRFNTEAESKARKELVKSEDFLLNKIFEIWSWSGKNDDANVFAGKCTELLNWYFESSEEKIVEFKRTKLINDHQLLIEKYWINLGDTKSLKNFDAFLSFCSMTLDEIEVMKINIANNINSWIDLYGLEKTHYFEMVQRLIPWVYGDDENERKRIIRNYMNSSHGSLLCLKLCKNCTDESMSHVVEFFNTWIEPSIDFEKLLLHLEQGDEPIVGSKTISGIRSALKSREKNYSVGRLYL